MEKAYALLGIHNLASAPEIEKAYRYKKRLYDLSRFVEGSPDWQFARARNAAIDEAYRYAKLVASDATSVAVPEFVINAPRRRRIARGDTYNNWSVQRPRGEFWGLLVICPLAVYILQLAAPAALYDLAPRGLRGTVWLLNIALLFLGYIFPLLARFVLLKRPVRNFVGMLLLFPFTMLSADIITSVLLRFSALPGSGAVYVPALYLLGFAPLFVLLHAHCAILGMSFPERPKKSVPTVRRLAAYTFTLALSVTLSLILSATLN